VRDEAALFLKNFERIGSNDNIQGGFDRLDNVRTTLFAEWNRNLHARCITNFETIAKMPKADLVSDPREAKVKVKALKEITGSWNQHNHFRFHKISRDGGRYVARTKKDSTKKDNDVNWPEEIQSVFDSAYKQWRIRGLAALDTMCNDLDKEVCQISEGVYKALADLKIRLKTRKLAGDDWRDTKIRIRDSFKQFRRRVKEAFVRSHDRLVDIEIADSEASVTLVMQAILNEVEVLFFVRKANGRLRAKEYDGTTRGHHRRMWQFLQSEIATDKFIGDVANDWYTQTLEDIAPSVTMFAKEVHKASDSWACMMRR
jgi:hypothetical protein